MTRNHQHHRLFEYGSAGMQAAIKVNEKREADTVVLYV